MSDTQPTRDSSRAEPSATSPLDAGAVERVLKLARLRVEGAELQRFEREFARVLVSFARLREVDVRGLEPLHSPASRTDVVRDDRATPSLPRASLLACAPNAEDGFFATPKAFGQDA